MEEREGMGRKASTKVMAVLVGEEVKPRVGVTSSSINISRVIGVSHWRVVILMRVAIRLAIEESLETKRSHSNAAVF